ncbi:MAG: hypothetical protein QW097_00985 [archaeon]
MENKIIIGVVAIIAIIGLGILIGSLGGGSFAKTVNFKCQKDGNELPCQVEISQDEIVFSTKAIDTKFKVKEANLKTCEQFGEAMWHCTGKTPCEIIQDSSPYKMKCPMQSGRYALELSLGYSRPAAPDETVPSECKYGSIGGDMLNCELGTVEIYFEK